MTAEVQESVIVVAPPHDRFHIAHGSTGTFVGEGPVAVVALELARVHVVSERFVAE